MGDQPMTGTLTFALAVLVWIVILSVTAGLVMHYARYRRYLRMYPGTKAIRGRVWRFTR